LAADAMAAMENYPWPGNVRELKNALTKAAILCDNGVISVADLPDEVQATASSAADLPGADSASLDELERDAILSALKRTDGHHQNAASLLGISRRTLSRKLKRYLIQ
jgi:transcriptional regulator of acetoin/glycerol metabolism